ncbi:hypothetical protein Tco_0824009, partial [Tanacetum coccineum]
NMGRASAIIISSDSSGLPQLNLLWLPVISSIVLMTLILLPLLIGGEEVNSSSHHMCFYSPVTATCLFEIRRYGQRFLSGPEEAIPFGRPYRIHLRHAYVVLTAKGHKENQDHIRDLRLEMYSPRDYVTLEESTTDVSKVDSASMIPCRDGGGWSEVGLPRTGVDMSWFSDGDEVGVHVGIDHRDAKIMTSEVEEEIVEPAGEVSPNSSDTRDGIVRTVEDTPVDLSDALSLFYHNMSEDFMKCQPTSFKGTEGVVGLIRWSEKMETVFHIKQTVQRNISDLMKLNDTKGMAREMRSQKLRETDVVEYVEVKKNNEHRQFTLKGSKELHHDIPTRLQDCCSIANNLMDQVDTNTRGQNVARAYVAGNNEEKKYERYLAALQQGYLSTTPTTEEAKIVESEVTGEGNTKDNSERTWTEDRANCTGLSEVFPEDSLAYHPTDKSYSTLNLESQVLECLSDYDAQVTLSTEKANVVADALSRKNRPKPLRVRALVMTIGLNLPGSARLEMLSRFVSTTYGIFLPAKVNDSMEEETDRQILEKIVVSESWSALVSIILIAMEYQTLEDLLRGIVIDSGRMGQTFTLNSILLQYSYHDKYLSGNLFEALYGAKCGHLFVGWDMGGGSSAYWTRKFVS